MRHWPLICRCDIGGVVGCDGRTIAVGMLVRYSLAGAPLAGRLVRHGLGSEAGDQFSLKKHGNLQTPTNNQNAHRFSVAAKVAKRRFWLLAIVANRTAFALK